MRPKTTGRILMKKWIRKITGIEDLQNEARAAQETAEAAKREAEAAKREEKLAKMSPKERATAKGEPWINVLDVKVNQDNIRNGFFELDWNELFIKDLILNGYGTESDPEEEIVDRWFRDIVYQMLEQEGLDSSRGAGYINVVPIDKGRSEIS